MTYNPTRIFGLISASLVVVTAASATQTIATFADPSPSGATPMFNFLSTGAGFTGTMTGGWSSTGLTLQTPGFTGAGSIANAKFTMSALNISAAGVATAVGGGPAFVQFTNAANTNVFRVQFDSATFNPFAIGGSTLLGNNVTFTGTNVPGGMTQQKFAFALANDNTVGNATSYTASFTSSAAVPEPASMAVLGLGALGLVRRRRNVRV